MTSTLLGHYLDVGVGPAGGFKIVRLPSNQKVASDSTAQQIMQVAVSLRDGPLLLLLASQLLREDLPSGAAFARELVKDYLHTLSGIGEAALTLPVAEVLNHKQLERLLARRPPLDGGEAMTQGSVLRQLSELHKSVAEKCLGRVTGLQSFMTGLDPSFGQLGRICFHLAENRTNLERPFAFLATYISGSLADGKWQYRPLSLAVKEFAADGHRQGLVGLLKPVEQAGHRSAFLKRLTESRQIFQALPWSLEEAYAFLKDIPSFESAGIITRVPDWWSSAKRVRPQVTVEIGEGAPSAFGVNGMLGFSIKLSLGNQTLTPAEWDEILRSKPGLVKIKGQWVEIDPEKLQEVLRHWNRVQGELGEGVSFLDGMRLLAGFPRFSSSKNLLNEVDDSLFKVEAGTWLKEKLEGLRGAASRYEVNGIEGLNAQLRPYQKLGVSWLWLANQLGMGACLADDMGLGKTIQILALFLLVKKANDRARGLVIVPASLIGNWLKEADTFAPSLRIYVLHSAFGSDISEREPMESRQADVVLTTYGTLHRAPWLKSGGWEVLVVDEAQAIKNPGTRQSQAVKAVSAKQRIAMTGTPVENRLSDLWSIFDFIAPGLLGNASQFSNVMRGAGEDEGRRYRSLRTLVSPYILRRLKTDRSIITDLPDKTESLTYCFLTKEQASLYRSSVDDLVKTLQVTDGMQRRGQVLAFLMRFKQICNHPSQWSGDGEYRPESSGKFEQLSRLVADILEKREKVLIFTQFREIGGPLVAFLQKEFGVTSLLLTGETPIKKRKEMVESFQQEDGPPVFILSVKAGGTGLNLTAASHVIHFDRWWNPAVENQATDRAFRIGQKRNVLVHKFICRGTIEERIEIMMVGKRKLAEELLTGSAEVSLTEMSDAEILNLVTLDITQVAVE